MPRVPVRSLAGPLMVAAGVWCAAGDVAPVAGDAATVRLAAPASLWWFVGGLLTSAFVAPWRRSPLLAVPALFSALAWLPVPLPSVALIWTGTMAWVPIGLAAVAAWCSRWSVSRQDPADVDVQGRPLPHALAAGGLTLMAAGLVLVSIHPRLPGGDEPHYLVITQSLLYDGDLRIENNHLSRDYLAYIDGPLRPDYIRRGQDGQIYSIHAPGVSVLVAPMFSVLGLRGAQATIAVMAGLAGALIWLAAWSAARHRHAAWFAWAAVVGSTTFLYQSVMIFPDGPAAALVAVALVIWLRLAQGQPVAGWWLAIASAGLAALPFLHTRFATLSAGFGVAILVSVWRDRSRDAGKRLRRVAAFSAVPVVGAVAWFGYFYLIYGTPNPTIPYGTDAGGTNLLYIPGGIAGLLFDQQFGLLAYSPVLALGILGWFWRPRSRPQPSLTTLGVILAIYLAAVSTYWMWWAGVPATPARLTTSVLPLLAPPIAIVWARGGTWLRTAATVLLMVSIAISMWVVSVDHGILAWNGRDAHALWLTAMDAVVDLPRAWPSFFWRLIGGDVRSKMPYAWHVLAWCTAFAVTALLCRAVGRSVSTPSLRTLSGILWLPLGLMVAAPLGWSMNDVAPINPAMAQVAILRHASAGERLLRIEPGRLGRLRSGEAPLRITVPRTDLPLATSAEWSTLNDVPAGLYDLQLSSRRPAGGTLTVWLAGRTGPAERFVLPRQSVHAMTLDLIGGAAALRFQPNLELAGGAGRLEMVPRRLLPGFDAPAQAVLRGSQVSVFLLDDEAYPEGRAFWIRGGRTVETMVVATDRATRSAAVRLVNGPMPNVVTVVTEAGTDTLTLAPSETRILTLSFEADALAPLVITSAEGFRPSDDGQSEDSRYLGVRIELE